jgi:hypothetical protein
MILRQETNPRFSQVEGIEPSSITCGLGADQAALTSSTADRSGSSVVVLSSGRSNNVTLLTLCTKQAPRAHFDRLRVFRMRQVDDRLVHGRGPSRPVAPRLVTALSVRKTRGGCAAAGRRPVGSSSTSSVSIFLPSIDHASISENG